MSICEIAMPRYYLRLSFEVLLPISNLEFYPGVYWSAMLRDWLRPYFAPELAELHIYPIPVQNGFRSYHPKDNVALDISIPQQHFAGFVEMLEDELQGRIKSTFSPQRLHFVPGKSIRLLGYTSLPIPDSPQPISTEYWQEECKYLASLPQLSIVFHTPLRLKPGIGYKETYRYLDPLGVDSQSFFSALNREFGLQLDDFPQIIDKGIIWLDVHYEKTLGGLIGGISIETPTDPDLLYALTAGQIYGIGKNRSFGFGFYYIAEGSFYQQLKKVDSLTTLLQRSASFQNLSQSLEEMKSGSPGPDNLAKEDLLSCGKSYLLSAQKMLLSKRLAKGVTLFFKKRSHSGNYRVIQVQNIHERHLLLAVLRQIDEPLDRLLSNDCYAYRSGKDYHQAAKRTAAYFRTGFTAGLKADIVGFFDSIPHQPLQLLLLGLFAYEPAVELIVSYMLDNALGIPQGNPLSPLLSNLVLIPFDREIKKPGLEFGSLCVCVLCVLPKAGKRSAHPRKPE